MTPRSGKKLCCRVTGPRFGGNAVLLDRSRTVSDSNREIKGQVYVPPAPPLQKGLRLGAKG